MLDMAVVVVQYELDKFDLASFRVIPVDPQSRVFLVYPGNRPVHAGQVVLVCNSLDIPFVPVYQ
jgi:hypothetical protein